ncbi:hypothetical protein [Thermocrinis sp.]
MNGFLSNKEGMLGLYLEGKSIELYVERGYIKGFYTDTEEITTKGINTLSFLLYSLFSMLDNPSALFTFKTDVSKNLIFELEEPVSAEELILQLQLAYQEFKSFLNFIITPYATFKVLKPFENMQNYDGKTFTSVILASKQPLINEIRTLRELFQSGFLDIGQFIDPEMGRKVYEIDYIVKNVDMKNVNIFSIFESLKMSKFTGCISINSAHSNYDLYLKNGRMVSLYPYSCDFFDFLLQPEQGSNMSIISIPEDILGKLILRHSKRKLIDSLPHDFVELGKIFIGIAKKGFSGLLTLQKGNEKMYFVYEGGALLASLVDKDQLKVARIEPYKDNFLLELVSIEPMENFLEVLHLLLINKVYGIILRHSNQIIQSIFYHLSSSDLFKVIEGSIYYRMEPIDREEEILGFLSFLLDVGYKVLGRKRLEEELEASLHPYKGVFKLLEVEDYTKLWNMQQVK